MREIEILRSRARHFQHMDICNLHYMAKVQELRTSFTLELEARSTGELDPITKQDTFEVLNRLTFYLTLATGAVYTSSVTLQLMRYQPAKDLADALRIAATSDAYASNDNHDRHMKELGRTWVNGCYHLQSDPFTDTINYTIFELPAFNFITDKQRILLRGSLHRKVE